MGEIDPGHEHAAQNDLMYTSFLDRTLSSLVNRGLNQLRTLGRTELGMLRVRLGAASACVGFTAAQWILCWLFWILIMHLLGGPYRGED